MIKSWYLAGAPVDGNTLLFPMDCLPMTVGRSRKSTLTIDSNGVSRTHARIEENVHAYLRVSAGPLATNQSSHLGGHRVTAYAACADSSRR